jgi:hypothetical protein
MGKEKTDKDERIRKSREWCCVGPLRTRGSLWRRRKRIEIVRGNTIFSHLNVT